MPHGIKSSLRWLLWQVIRGILRCYMAVETSTMDSSMIFSQNLFCIAIK